MSALHIACSSYILCYSNVPDITCKWICRVIWRDAVQTGNGTVSRGEWIDCFIKQFGATSDQALAAFRNLDSSGSGELSVDQLKRLFSTMDTDGKVIVADEMLFRTHYNYYIDFVIF